MRRNSKRRPPAHRAGPLSPGTRKGSGLAWPLSLQNEECAVIAAEAKHAGTPPPQVQAWAVSTAETCAAKLNREDWPQKAEDLKKFASKKRRTEGNFIKEHKCDPQTLRWLTIAWAKQEGPFSRR